MAAFPATAWWPTPHPWTVWGPLRRVWQMPQHCCPSLQVLPGSGTFAKGRIRALRGLRSASLAESRSACNSWLCAWQAAQQRLLSLSMPAVHAPVPRPAGNAGPDSADSTCSLRPSEDFAAGLLPLEKLGTQPLAGRRLAVIQETTGEGVDTGKHTGTAFAACGSNNVCQ